MKDVVAVQSPTTVLVISEAVPTKPRDNALRWHVRTKNRFGAMLFAAMSLFVMTGQAGAVTVPSLLNAQSTCKLASRVPLQGGSAVSSPGHWTNGNRYGTGWDLIYSDDKRSLKLFFFTYSQQGFPIWFATPMTRISADSGNYFSASLNKYTASNTATPIGSVAIRFLPDDPSKVAIVWQWDSVTSPQTECIQDIVRIGPNYYNPASGGATTSDATSSSAVLTGSGINQLWSGYWNTNSVAGQYDSVPGVVVNILQTTQGNSGVGYFGEFDLVVTFDSSGQPVWLQAQGTNTSTLPPASSQSITLAYDQPVASKYPGGVPLQDCSNNSCITYQTVGTLVRTFSTSAMGYGLQGTVSLQSSLTQPLNNFNAAAAAQQIAGAFPPVSPTKASIYKITKSTGIVVDQYSCVTTLGGTCAVFVSWNVNAVDAGASPYRHDLNKNTYTSLIAGVTGVSAANGVMPDSLSQGDRVAYELWNGNPPTGTLFDKTAEVRAYGPTNADGTAYVPDAPQTSLSSELPAAGNDATVGTMAGSAGVDGGAATYTIPIVLPPGRNGMQPEVSLNYNSRSGNGIAGMGWSLSGASSIHRCPQTVAQDGINRGVQLDGNDRLCLDGQRLVPVNGGSYGASGTIYDTEVRSFSQVTQSNALNSQFSSFSVQMKNGRTLTYGTTPAGSACVTNVSQVVPGGVTAPLSWLLTQTKDPQGNWMDYCYKAGAAGEVLLKNIVYTSAAGMTGNRSVYMNYLPRPTTGTANDVSVSYLAGGMSFQTQRLQSIATYVNYVSDANKGELVRQYSLNYTKLGAAQDYDIHSGRSLLWSVQECGLNGTACRKATQFNWADGPSQYGFTNLTLSSTLGAVTGAGVVPDPQPSDTTMAQPPQIGTTGDFDGDGSREVVVSQYQGDATTGTTHWYVAKSNTDRTIGVPVDVTSLENGGFGLSATGRGQADFGGDGRATVLGGATQADQSLKILSWQLGRGVAIPQGATAATLFRQIPTYIPLPPGSGVEATADFNNDGYPDVLISMPVNYLQSGLCPAATSTNAHLGPPPPPGGGPNPIIPPPGIEPVVPPTETAITSGASTGQTSTSDTGTTESTTTTTQTVALCLYLNTTRAPITGATSSYGFSVVPQPVTTLFNVTSTISPGGSFQHVDHVSDFNGDGAADIWISTTYDNGGGYSNKSLTTLWQAQPASGTGPGGIPGVTFIARDPALSIKVDSRVAQGAIGVSYHWLDINGDGLEDLVFAVPPTCSSTCPPGTWQVQLNKGGTLSPAVTPVSGANLGLIVSAGSMRYADGMPTADVDNSGRASLLFPTKFAARVCSFVALRPLQPLECTGTAIAPGGSSIAGSTSTTIGPPYTCLVWACPEEPDPTSPTATEDPVAVPPPATDHGLGIVKMYGKHRGIDDSSSYYMSALRFSHSVDAGGNDQIAVISSPTSIIARLNSGTDGQADLFGDGLADYTTLVGCNQTVTYTPDSDPKDNLVFPTCWPLSGTASTGKSYGPTTLPDGTSVASLQANAYQYLNANTGVASLANGLPILPELMQNSINGLGDTATWDYFPLSTGGGRASTQLPLYTFRNSVSYVADPEYYFFTSSMPVVGFFTQTNGVDTSDLGFRSTLYGYDGAIYDHLGRGFQGFRQISIDPLLGNGGTDLNNNSRGLRTVTTYEQKFPLTGKIYTQEVGVATSGTTMTNVSTTTNSWGCNTSLTALPLRTQFCPADPTAPIQGAPAPNTLYSPFLDTSSIFTYDLAKAQQGTLSLLDIAFTYNASISSAARGNGTSGWDQYGNIKTQIVAKTDFDAAALLSQQRTTTNNVYDYSQLASGWMNKLQSSTVTQTVSYTAAHAAPSGVTTSGQSVETFYSWNCLDRSLAWKATLDLSSTATAAAQAGCGVASVPSVSTGVITTTAYGYPSPSYGLPQTTTANANGLAASRTTTYGYSSDGYFVSSAKNPLQQTTTMLVRPEDGQTASVTDPNSLTVTNSYDGFGHVIATTYTNPIGTQQPMVQTAWTNCLTSPGSTTCSNDGESAASYISTTVQDGAPTQVVAYDILGRVIDKAARGFNTDPATGTGIFVHETTNYDTMGTVIATMAPNYQGTGSPKTRFWYDAQNRVLQKLAPTGELNATQGNTLTKYTYAGDTTTIAVAVGTSCSPANLCFTMKRVGSVIGKYMQTTETDPTTGSVLTNYWYDAAGNTVGIQDGKGSTTSAIYNGFGQRTQSNDPNQGLWTFAYDGLGELIQQTDARGAVTQVTSRDSLGRVLTQTATPPVAGAPPGMTNEITQDTWSYDIPVIGAPTTITRLRGATAGTLANVWSETYTYDPYTKRLTKRSTTQEKETGGVLATMYQYDAYYGREKAITYPSGFTAWRQYNNYGDLSSLVDAKSLTPAWTKLQTDAFGHTTSEQFGYAVVGTHTYSASTGQARTMNWTTLPNNLNHLTTAIDGVSYVYDSLGNLTSQTRNGAWESYTYDILQRLTGTTRSNGTPVNYLYDAVGNLMSKSDYSSVTYGAYVYGSTKPNAVTQVSLAAGGSDTYNYDNNGNVIGGTAVAEGYDVNNQARTIQRTGVGFTGYATFFYGPTGARYREEAVTNTTIFGSDGYERSGAMHRHELGPVVFTVSSTATTPVYMLRDRLGSVLTEVDINGNIYSNGTAQRSYDAFGKVRNNDFSDSTYGFLNLRPVTQHGFTGQEHQDDTRVIHMNGRIYDYTLGRFLGVDPIVENPLSSQSLNPYSYLGNNPLSGSDPTGFATCDAGAQVSGGCLESGVNTITKDGNAIGTVIVGNKGETGQLTDSVTNKSITFTIGNGAQRVDYANILSANTPADKIQSLTSKELGPAKSAAMMSQCVYGSCTLPSNVRPIDLGFNEKAHINPGQYEDPGARFHAEGFVSDDGNDAYLAFRGTKPTSLRDWETNTSQIIGNSRAYGDADSLGRAFSKGVNSNKLYTGHSLGGGEASLAALTSGERAITFNSAGLSSATLSRYKVSGASGANSIQAYYLRGEILSTLQDHSPLPRAVGTRSPINPVSSTPWSPVARHGIDSVLDAMNGGQ
jgi:RHS repeat-associated protein